MRVSPVCARSSVRRASGRRLTSNARRPAIARACRAPALASTYTRARARCAASREHARPRPPRDCPPPHIPQRPAPAAARKRLTGKAQAVCRGAWCAGEDAQSHYNVAVGNARCSSAHPAVCSPRACATAPTTEGRTRTTVDDEGTRMIDDNCERPFSVFVHSRNDARRKLWKNIKPH